MPFVPVEFESIMIVIVIVIVQCSIIIIVILWGSLPFLSPRDVQTGASVDNRHMLSDGTNHRRILKETEKQSGRVTIVATIVWVGIAW